MSVSDLPTVNALLNGLAFTFLLIGFVFIRQKKIPQHRAMMLAAFTTSAVFLVSYLYYHFNSAIISARGIYSRRVLVSGTVRPNWQ